MQIADANLFRRLRIDVSKWTRGKHGAADMTASWPRALRRDGTLLIDLSFVGYCSSAASSCCFAYCCMLTSSSSRRSF